MYSDYGLSKSHITRTLKKQQHPQFHDILKKALPPHADSFTTTNRVNTLISYYEENDYYDEHHDAYLFTCLIWFAKDSSLFTGGDLILTQSNQTIKFKHNRMLLFPCYYKHKVTPIKFNEEVKKKDNGRFCITHFYHSVDN
jgi:Rps23 Pro-64 3,4-dihydroxylase Tpa1-like proline 4-hydroxylase